MNELKIPILDTKILISKTYINLVILGTPTAHTNRGDSDIQNSVSSSSSIILNCVIRNTELNLLEFLLPNGAPNCAMATAFCVELTNLGVK